MNAGSKSASLFPERLQPSIVRASGFQAPIPKLEWLALCVGHVKANTAAEFMGAVILSCPEDTVSLWLSQTSDSCYIFASLLFDCFWAFKGGNINVSFVVEDFTDIYSFKFDRLWVLIFNHSPHPPEKPLFEETFLMRSARIYGLERYKCIGKFDTISIYKYKSNRCISEACELPAMNSGSNLQYGA